MSSSPSLFGADWERTMLVQDPRSGLRAILVIHSLARGPAVGGVRRYAYADEASALADARRLAEAMSLKCAAAGLDAGGAKTVILDHPGLDRERAYEVLGRAIGGLGGDYLCGPDIGTGPTELAALRRGTRWVNPEANDASASTAAGVLAGLRGLAEVALGSAELGAHRYVIQGLGGVGMAIARTLREAGAWVGGFDLREQARAEAAAIGVEILAREAVFTTPCDVFMPCALGQVLTVETCAAGPWRAVCGSANNQFMDREAARVLHARGVPWAPDFIVNAGAVIEGVLTVLGRGGDESEADLRDRVGATIGAIRERCGGLVRDSRASGKLELELAEARAREILRAAREH